MSNKKNSLTLEDLNKEELLPKQPEVRANLRREQLIKALFCQKELSTKISQLLNTSLLENNIVYKCFSEDAYLSALHVADHLRNMLQIGDMKDMPRYGTLISPLRKPVNVYMLRERGMIKIDIPLLPSKSIKKRSELETLEQAVSLGIEEFRENDPNGAENANKFRDIEYAIIEQYIIPKNEMIDLDRVDFSKVIDIISINFCCGFDDSRRFRTQVRTIKNFGSHRYACLYLVEKNRLYEQLQWIENDL